MPKNIRSTIWYSVAALTLITAMLYWAGRAAIAPISYSHFQQLLREQKISDVTVSEHAVQALLKEPLPDGRVTVSANRVDPVIAKELEQYGVTYTAAGEGQLAQVLSWILPLAVFVGWIFLMRSTGTRQGFGLAAVGRSRAKVYIERDTKVTFADVAGVDEAKRELQEVVSFLKAPAAYARLGARMPKGILLVGPPGTGKTLLARAVAGEAGVPFFSISGSEFVEMFVGVGAARVRDLFDQASATAPCIIFIDELDAMGRARGFSVISGSNDEKEQTLNQLLVEMDGFDPRKGVVLLAATNRPEILDPALLRAGRFDRQVLLDRPDKVGRLAILKTHTARLTLAPGVELEKIAALTVGFSGADLATLANEAALAATRRNAPSIALEDFTAAFERIVAGIEKNRHMNEHERKIVAHHEMGHALVAMSMPGSDAVHKISIIPRGIGAIGYTLQRPAEDRYITSRQDLVDKLAVLLGGRMAEILSFNELSTGAGDDLAKATDIARSMVMQYGMDEGLGHVVYEPRRLTLLDIKNVEGPRQFSEQTAREIDCAVRKLLDGAAERAKAILSANRALLNQGAALLLERETLTEDALTALKAKLCAPGLSISVPIAI
ncbi:MAG: ATP-dependent zinc metalloprotease FtsH [Rhodospirillaceae bacterium]